MRLKATFVSFLSVALVFVGWFFYHAGVFSTPRDYSSPQITIRLFDDDGSHLGGIEVERTWYDSDCGKEGSDTANTDHMGVATFPKVPAKVGLFTGAWRKAYSILGMCGAGSGTHTTVYVRYHGLCKVTPKGKLLHPVGQSYRDPEGVWFYTSTDGQSNTLANLMFTEKAKSIDYALTSRPFGQ